MKTLNNLRDGIEFLFVFIFHPIIACRWWRHSQKKGDPDAPAFKIFCMAGVACLLLIIAMFWAPSEYHGFAVVTQVIAWAVYWILVFVPMWKLTMRKTYPGHGTQSA